MSWTLNFTVLNNTGNVIENVSAIHTCDGQATGIQATSLANGSSTPNPPAQATTYSMHKDYYKVSFIMNGEAYAGDCYCSADSDDTGVVLQLHADYWNVQYSSGDKCSDKSYND